MTQSPSDVRRHWGRWAAASLALTLVIVAGGLWSFQQVTGTSVFVRYGGTVWIPVNERTAWLPLSVRMALRRQPPAASPGPMTWREIAPGFEVASLPAMAEGREADRIELARIDPARWRFAVRNDPSGGRNLDRWMADTHAVLVINGSYYGRDGGPDTPVVIDGAWRGPADYDARQGAFVSSPGAASIHDLAHQDWRTAFAGSQAAMVSYPLLIAEDGSSRAPVGSGWLANRSFIGQDRQGRVILGTTRGAFFSLDRLAAFLKAAPLDLKLALDLDGGPVACQGVDLAGYRRATCGRWELQVDKAGHAKVLPSWPWAHAAMPMALAVYPRRD